MFDDKDLVNIALFGCLLLSLVPVKEHLGLADTATATGSSKFKRHAFFMMKSAYKYTEQNSIKPWKADA